MKNKERMGSLDFIRASAIFMVITLHASSGVLYQIESVSTGVWNAHNLIDSFVRVCVPLFFMVSGYLLLAPATNSDHSPLPEVGRRILKILVPLLAWSFGYCFYIAYMTGEPLSFTLTINSLRSIFQGAVVYHLWFLYELLIIYLLIPVLRPLVRESDAPAIYFCCLWLFLSTLQAMAFLLSWNYPFGGHINLGNTGFFVAGYLVRKHIPEPRPIDAIFAACCYLICAVITTILTAQMRAIVLDDTLSFSMSIAHQTLSLCLCPLLLFSYMLAGVSMKRTRVLQS